MTYVYDPRTGKLWDDEGNYYVPCGASQQEGLPYQIRF